MQTILLTILICIPSCIHAMYYGIPRLTPHKNKEDPNIFKLPSGELYRKKSSKDNQLQYIWIQKNEQNLALTSDDIYLGAQAFTMIRSRNEGEDGTTRVNREIAKLDPFAALEAASGAQVTTAEISANEVLSQQETDGSHDSKKSGVPKRSNGVWSWLKPQWNRRGLSTISSNEPPHDIKEQRELERDHREALNEGALEGMLLPIVQSTTPTSMPLGPIPGLPATGNFPSSKFDPFAQAGEGSGQSKPSRPSTSPKVQRISSARDSLIEGGDDECTFEDMFKRSPKTTSASFSLAQLLNEESKMPSDAISKPSMLPSQEWIREMKKLSHKSTSDQLRMTTTTLWCNERAKVHRDIENALEDSNNLRGEAKKKALNSINADKEWLWELDRQILPMLVETGVMDKLRHLLAPEHDMHDRIRMEP